MSGMKNLSLALDELAEAEVRALLAGKWKPVEVKGLGLRWQEPKGINTRTQDDAIFRLKGTYEVLRDS